MKYSIDIMTDVYSLSYCLKKITDGIDDLEDWEICININFPTDKVFLNCDIDNKTIRINNKQDYDILQDLDTIIERVKKINSGYIF